MGLLGMALGGAGAAAGDLANKYLDAQFANQRAQVLADIQRNSQQQYDQYLNSPGRREGLRAQDALDAGSKATQARADDLARLQDTSLIDAGAAATNRVSDATRATRTADLVAAEDAKLATVNPGDKRFRGPGENTNPTAAEFNLMALREGLKGKTGEERDRAMEAATKSIGERLKDLDKAMIDGVKEGTLSPTAPKPEKGWFGDKEAKPNPAYDNYQQLLRQKRQLEQQQRQIIEEWRGAAPAAGASPTMGKSGPDPLGLRTGANLKAGPAEAAMRPVVALSAEEQARSDKFEASPANIAQLQEAIRTARNPDHKALLEQELANLTAPKSGGLIAAAAAAPAPAKKAAPEPEERRETPRQALATGDAPRKPGQDPRARVAAAQAKQADSQAAIRASFEQDMDTMGVVEFARKYDSQRSALTSSQLATLAKIMRKL